MGVSHCVSKWTTVVPKIFGRSSWHLCFVPSWKERRNLKIRSVHFNFFLSSECIFLLFLLCLQPIQRRHSLQKIISPLQTVPHLLLKLALGVSSAVKGGIKLRGQTCSEICRLQSNVVRTQTRNYLSVWLAMDDILITWVDVKEPTLFLFSWLSFWLVHVRLFCIKIKMMASSRLILGSASVCVSKNQI